MLRLNFIVFLLANLLCFTSSFSVHAKNNKEKEDWVEVRGTGFSLDRTKDNYRLQPYTSRRHRWGHTVSLGYSNFKPVNYDPDFSSNSFEDIYDGGKNIPLIEGSYHFKWNFILGSLGLEMGGGFYRITSTEDSNEESELTLVPVFMGAVYSLDNVFTEPVIAPYIGGGAYAVFYREDLVSGAQPRVEGSTQPHYYAKAGVMLQVDWIVPSEARNAYAESGIENTFLFIEGRFLYTSPKEQDPDFASRHWNAGIKLEF